MASLDSLPGDQRAVLQLVLGRGRSYTDIAGLLRIPSAAVRQRALSALDALGPETDIAAEDRGVIADYLLGQLDPEAAAAVRARVAGSPPDRAWAGVLLAEIAPLAAGPLPEIPRDAAGLAPPPAVAEPEPPPVDGASRRGANPPAGAPRRPRGRPALRRLRRAPAPAAPSPTSDAPPSEEPAGSVEAPRSSRRGGAVLLGLAVLLIAAFIVFVVKPFHHDTPKNAVALSNPTAVSTTSTAPASSATGSSSATATTSTTAKPITQINLTPASAGSKAAAIADVLLSGGQRELAIVGQDLPANTAHNSYEVWLYNTSSDAKSLGFVNPGVTSNGKLSAASPLPADAGHYKELIVTQETAVSPKTPGPVVLQGAITGLS